MAKGQLLHKGFVDELQWYAIVFHQISMVDEDEEIAVLGKVFGMKPDKESVIPYERAKREVKWLMGWDDLSEREYEELFKVIPLSEARAIEDRILKACEGDYDMEVAE